MIQHIGNHFKKPLFYLLGSISVESENLRGIRTVVKTGDLSSVDAPVLINVVCA